MARALRRDHADVEVGARLDQVEVDVEAVREHQRRAVLHVRGEMLPVDVGLQLVGRQHHDDVGPLGGLGDVHDLELLLLGLGGRGRALAERDRDVLDAAVAEVERVRMTLAAVADDGDLLGLDQIDVGIPIVIDAHGAPLLVCIAVLGPRIGVFRSATPNGSGPRSQGETASSAGRGRRFFLVVTRVPKHATTPV